jgi:hypothetical protein
VPTPKKGGIMGFTIRREVCIGCRAALSDQENIVSAPVRACVSVFDLCAAAVHAMH